MSSGNEYLELASGKVLRGGAPPSGFFVRGRMQEGRFIPEGDVEGDGQLGDSGMPGWLEVADGSFHGDQTARPPFPPFIRGVQSSSGEFRPTSREIVR